MNLPPRLLLAGCCVLPLFAPQTVAAQADAGDPPLSVLLISMDTTRADHLGCYGHPAKATPNIDRVARQGTLFEQCYSVAPITLPSHSSMFTSTLPFVHGVRDNGVYRLRPENLTITEVLKENGFATAGVVGAFVLDRAFGLSQGFDDYSDVRRVDVGGSERATRIREANQVTDHALEALRKIGEQRFFLFVHYFDPHERYEPPPPWAGKFNDPYLEEIAFVDEQIGRLLAGLDELKLTERTLVIITGDHGEGRGDHDESTHGYFVYDSTLRVPLIMRAPRRIPPGRRVGEQVRLIDLAPTILDLVGGGELPHAQGSSLVGLLRGDAESKQTPRPVYSETLFPRTYLKFSQLRSLRAEGWKYIHADPPELYNVAADPRETRNLADEQPDRVRDMREALRQIIADTPRVAARDDATRALDDEELQKLEALGYAGGVPAAEDAADELDLFDPDGPNPMTNVAIIKLLGPVAELIADGKPQEAEKRLREVLKLSGDRAKELGWVHARLGTVLAQQRRIDEAIVSFQVAVAANPRDGRTMTGLGLLLGARKRYDESIEVFERAVKLDPVFAITHINYGNVLTQAGKPDAAIEQFRTAIRKDPKQVRAQVGLGRALAATGKLDEAIAAVDAALEIARPSGNDAFVQQLETLREQYRLQRDTP